MSTTIDIANNGIQNPLKESDLSLSAVSENGVIEPDDNNRILLKFSPSRSLFLMKVGLIFVIFTTLIMGILTWQAQGNKSFKYWATILNLESNWILTISIITFELIFNGFFGFIWPKGFLINVILVVHWFIRILGLMIAALYFEKKVDDPAQLYNYLLRMMVGMIWLNWIVFSFCTLIRDNIDIFRAWISFWIMNFCGWIYLYFVPRLLEVPAFGFPNYVKLAAAMFLFNIYIVLNAKFIVNYRTMKFYDDEFVFCYWAFWTDWFSYFWIDLFKKRTHRVEMTRLAQIKRNIELKRKGNEP